MDSKKADVDNSIFKDFLNEFCTHRDGPLSDQTPLPSRVLSAGVTEAEIEGECLDWLQQFLHTLKCPGNFATVIAREVTDQVLATDLGAFIEPPEDVANPDKDETLSETEDNKTVEEGDFKKLHRFIATKVMRVAYNKLVETCHKWQETGIPYDIPSEQTSPLDVSLCSIKNTRRRMEDRHIIISDLNLLFRLKGYPCQSFLAVLDGHGGVDAAIYTSTQLHVNMVRHKAFQADPEKAILAAFKDTDCGFIRRCKRDNLQSGSTCISVLVRGRMVYLAWLGDSQAVLVRDGQPVHIMNPHTPERQDERERIEGLGGCVLWFGTWRVNGTLSVSRAIGDPGQKPYVSSDADITSFELDGTEEFLVIGCDGLWDALASDRLVSLVNDHLKESEGDRSTVAQKLVRAAKENGSTDNITVIVVFFNHSLISQVCTESSERLEEKISESSTQDSSGHKQTSDKMEKDSQESEKACKNDSQKGSSQGDSSHQTSSNSILYTLDEFTASSKSDSQRPVKSSSRENSASTNHSVQSLANQSHESLDKAGSPVEASQEPSEESPLTKSNDQENEKGEVHSDTSATDLALMARTASRCLSSRRAKRSKSGSFNGSKNGSKNGSSRSGSRNGSRNGRNGRGKENRRMLRGRLGAAGLMPYANSRAPPRSRSAESNLSLAQKNVMRSGDQIFQMLTGCSPNVMRKVKGPVGKWTVAVEIESASAMFEDRPTIWERSRRRSDTDHHYKK